MSCPRDLSIIQESVLLSEGKIWSNFNSHTPDTNFLCACKFFKQHSMLAVMLHGSYWRPVTTNPKFEVIYKMCLLYKKAVK